MKSKIFMYLFIFALLFILFQFVNSQRYFEQESAKMERLQETNTQLEDSIQSVLLENAKLEYFTLNGNDDALGYIPVSLEDPERWIADKLLETNETDGNNPLVPYEGMTGSPMKINKIHVLNHKWIIADFSDGKYWGEILLRYEIKEDTSVDFTLVDHLLYTRS